MNLPFAFVHASQISLVAFVAICIAILLAFVSTVVYSQRNSLNSAYLLLRLSGAVVAYCVFIAGVVYSGLLESLFIPLGPMFLLGTVSFAIAIGFTPLVTKVSTRVSLAWLVGFQGFRLPLELVLHDWYASGTIPETMTWSGSNWDILSGIFALLSCFFVNDRRWLAWVFNIVGIILLLNVGRVAIMSSPVPFRWQVDPPLELILFLPYAYIVPICVGGAAIGHTLLTRKLLSARDFNSQDSP